jgi:rhomboid protease GluP
VVYIICALNIAYYAWMVIKGVHWLEPTAEDLIKWGADHSKYTTGGQWWRLITSAFMHAGAFHIAFNMWALLNVGSLMERLLGNFYFLVLYMACAVLSGLCSVWIDGAVASVGASGAIFGVFGALLSYLVFQKKSVPREIAKSISGSTLFFIGYNVMIGLANKGISNAAHIGGLIAGLILGAFLARPLALESRLKQTAPRLVIGVLVAGALIAWGIYSVPRFENTREGRFLAMEDRFNHEEKEMEHKILALFADYENDKIGEKVLAVGIEKEVLPALDSMVAWLTPINPAGDKDFEDEHKLMLNFAVERRKGFALFAQGCKTGDKVKIEEGREIFSQAMKRLNDGIKAQKSGDAKP